MTPSTMNGEAVTNQRKISPMPKTVLSLGSEEDALRRARDLVPALRQRARAVDENRALPREAIKDLVDSGLFGITTPRAFGGSELGFATLVRVTSTIAAACGSTGWVYGVLAGHSWLLNLFPLEAQQEILEDPRALIATVFRLGGQIVEADGGYRLTGGEGRFCTGIDHATWVIVGNSVRKPDGGTEARFFVLPRSDIEVVDDWFTVGLRGTGSRSIRIADAFIPAHRSVSLKDMLDGTSPGAKVHKGVLYRQPFSDVVPFSIIGAPLGIAQGAVRDFAANLGGRLNGKDDMFIAQQSPTLARLATAGAEADAAMALTLENATRIESAEDPGAIAPLDRARLPRDWAYAVQTARKAVNRIFEAAGGSAVYADSDLQRVWRDANAAAQHFAFTWDSAMATFGRTMIGARTDGFTLKSKSR
jgi:alkylation response protein AidB-like acyl-CoA dehydrogenase